MVSNLVIVTLAQRGKDEILTRPIPLRVDREECGAAPQDASRLGAHVVLEREIECTELERQCHLRMLHGLGEVADALRSEHDIGRLHRLFVQGPRRFGGGRQRHALTTRAWGVANSTMMAYATRKSCRERACAAFWRARAAIELLGVSRSMPETSITAVPTNKS